MSEITLISGTKDRYVKYDAKTLKYGMYAIIIFICFFVVFLLIFAFYYEDTKSKSKVFDSEPVKFVSRSIPLSNITRHGSSVNGTYYSFLNGIDIDNAASCGGVNTAKWNSAQGKCFCVSPFWGTKCERQTYDEKYNDIGIGNEDDIMFDEIINEEVESLSFPYMHSTTSCTTLCDETDGCNGVYWQPNNDGDASGLCTLFRSASIFDGRRLLFDHRLDANIFAKNINSITFDDRVFIYENEPSARYHTIDVLHNKHIIAYSGIRYRINFYPSEALHGFDMKGIYSPVSFSPNDYDDILEQGNTNLVYIHSTTMPLQVPLLWGDQPIFLMYK